MPKGGRVNIFLVAPVWPVGEQKRASLLTRWGKWSIGKQNRAILLTRRGKNAGRGAKQSVFAPPLDGFGQWRGEMGRFCPAAGRGSLSRGRKGRDMQLPFSQGVIQNYPVRFDRVICCNWLICRELHFTGQGIDFSTSLRSARNDNSHDTKRGRAPLEMTIRPARERPISRSLRPRRWS